MQQLLGQDAEEHGKRDAADRADARAEDFFAASAQNDEAHDRNQRTKQECGRDRQPAFHQKRQEDHQDHDHGEDQAEHGFRAGAAAHRDRHQNEYAEYQKDNGRPVVLIHGGRVVAVCIGVDAQHNALPDLRRLAVDGADKTGNQHCFAFVLTGGDLDKEFLVSAVGIFRHLADLAVVHQNLNNAAFFILRVFGWLYRIFFRIMRIEIQRRKYPKNQHNDQHRRGGSAIGTAYGVVLIFHFIPLLGKIHSVKQASAGRMLA